MSVTRSSAKKRRLALDANPDDTTPRTLIRAFLETAQTEQPITRQKSRIPSGGISSSQPIITSNGPLNRVQTLSQSRSSDLTPKGLIKAFIQVGSPKTPAVHLPQLKEILPTLQDLSGPEILVSKTSRLNNEALQNDEFDNATFAHKKTPSFKRRGKSQLTLATLEAELRNDKNPHETETLSGRSFSKYQSLQQAPESGDSVRVPRFIRRRQNRISLGTFSKGVEKYLEELHKEDHVNDQREHNTLNDTSTDMFDNADTQEENQPDHIEKDYFSEANALSRDVNVRQTHLPIAESTRLYENDLSESDELHHNDDAKNKMFIEKKQNFDHVSDNEVDDDDDDVDDAADGEENDDNSDAKVDDNYGEVNDAHQVIDDDDDDAADGEEDMDDNNGEVNDAHQIDDDDEMDDEDINAEVQYNDDDDAAKMDEHEAINDADNHNTNEEEECDIASEEEDYIVIEEGHVSEVDVMEENRVGLQRKMLPIRKPARTKQQSKTTLPKSLIKNMFTFHSRLRVSPAAMDAVYEGSEKFFKHASHDLLAYIIHAGRKTVSQVDLELLMKRQRFVTEKQSLTLLVEKYMPLEYRQELIPVARSGNIVEPK